MAIAVQNAVNYSRAGTERDRSQLLLRINNATTTHLDLRQLLIATSESLRSVIDHDFAGLALYEPGNRQLRIHTTGAPELQSGEDGTLVPLDQSPTGKSFTTRRPVVVERLNTKEYPSILVERAVAAGFQSSCSAPLIFQGNAVGAVFIGSRK